MEVNVSYQQALPSSGSLSAALSALKETCLTNSIHYEWPENNAKFRGEMLGIYL